jgi:AcrR family transcriptional regulator
MSVTRLDAEERRRSIVAAALPLFARKGFVRTTTKEIAEAARVSEALVFKHFPSKAALYEEILRAGCQGDPALERLCALAPSTSSLVHMMHFMVHHFVRGALGDPDGRDTRHRLMVNSFIEDGEYARLVFDMVLERVFPKFAACLEAADAAGDLVDMPVPHRNRFWLAQHVAAMLACVRLPGRPVVPYEGGVDEVVADATRFILRGIGLTDAAIRSHFNAPALSILLNPA